MQMSAIPIQSISFYLIWTLFVFFLFFVRFLDLTLYTIITRRLVYEF